MILIFTEEEKEFLIVKDGRLTVDEDAPPKIKKKLEFILKCFT